MLSWVKRGHGISLIDSAAAHNPAEFGKMEG